MIQQIQAVVVAGRGQGPQPELAEWLCSRGVQFRMATPGYSPDVVRNRAIRRYLDGEADRRPYLLLLDADMVPIDTQGDAILHEQGDALWLAYAGTEGSPGHDAQRGTIGLSACRLSADVLRRIGGDWCQIEYDAHRERVLHCDCTTLDRKIRAAGIEPRCVGVIGHAQRCVILPADTVYGWRLLWPGQLGG